MTGKASNVLEVPVCVASGLGVVGGGYEMGTFVQSVFLRVSWYPNLCFRSPAGPIQTLLPLTQLYPEDTVSSLSHRAELLLSRTAVWHCSFIFLGKVLCLHTPVPAPCLIWLTTPRSQETNSS